MKKTKFAIAAFLVNPKNGNEFLVVKRPKSDDILPNVYGLPAVTVNDGELPEQAVRRIGTEKLNTNIEPIEFMGIKSGDREKYKLILMVIKTKLVGSEPSVATARTHGTKYVDQRWTSNLRVLKEAASNGSLCSQIILDLEGLDY